MESANTIPDSARMLQKSQPDPMAPVAFEKPSTDENDHTPKKSTHEERGTGNARDRGARDSRHKRSDMGRAEWSRNPVDKRARNERAQQDSKRRKINGDKEEVPIYAVEFSKEEIEQEGRKPKRKVAVMIGYSGSGYKGMQVNHNEKTIEGDLFGAFVAAGAISKANATDPKKSSLVRCARTDKGVHAAGNILSLKLIIEDPDVVKKINDHLSPQIRVWGMERTSNSFSAYQLCDSRIYEYLIPTHAFLPPHPNSFLGRKLEELAKEADDKGFYERQKEVSTFWAEVEEQYIKPVLESLDPSLRSEALSALYDPELIIKTKEPLLKTEDLEQAAQLKALEGDIQSRIPLGVMDISQHDFSGVASKPKDPSPLEAAIRSLRNAYVTAKKAHRIHPGRLSRVRSSLSRFVGTHNFHNYTIHKTYRDASARRIIKSFLVNSTPLLINNTEWLSLKVHGQSFMMHQIRKMVSMVALVVRCGCHEGRLQDTYLADKVSIPKAPGLGLLLERPVFDSYNERMGGQNGRERIEFDKFSKEMEEFKQREIYERIFREEERDNQFHTFFASIDNLKSPQFLYLSSLAIQATRRPISRIPESSKAQVGEEALIDDASSEDDEDPEDG
ncbi:tRNA pseudouridine synthase 1 [Toensbergia leucococca]|nr:tRNA pseudouridine synthase 1 [Toensbergia leucococca]